MESIDRTLAMPGEAPGLELRARGNRRRFHDPAPVEDLLGHDEEHARMSDSAGTRKSKSQRKRESLALQALGESLASLSPNDLARIPMWPELEAAVAEASGLERVARRRQIRFIARLLRDGDPGPVAGALDAVRRPGRREAARHRRIERLRDALMRDGAALDELRAAVTRSDFQQLRHLVAAARRERENASGSTSERRLFRFLRDRGLDAPDPSTDERSVPGSGATRGGG